MVSRQTRHSDRNRRLFDTEALLWSERYAVDGAVAGLRASFSAALDGRVPPEGRVLDLRCGTGDIARSLVTLGMRVTACDTSREMLRHACGHELSGAIEWVLLDIGWRILPFPSDTFHAVVAASVLEYTDSPGEILGECSQVLRPGGIMVCAVPNLANPERWIEWTIKFIASSPGILTSAGMLSPRLGRYLVYLRASRHQHLAKWCSAAAADRGLLEISPRSRAPSNIPLHMLIFYRPEYAIDPCHSPVSPPRCAESSPPGITTVQPPEMTTLTDQVVSEIERTGSTCQDLLQPGTSMSKKERRRRTGLSAKPNRFPSPEGQAKRPPHANASRQKKPHGQALSGTLATNIALALLGVATGVIAARILGPEGEGEIAAIQTWPLLLGTLSMLGLDSAVVYFGARQPDKGKQFTTTATLIGLLSSVVVGGAAWFALPLLLAAQRAQIVSAARIFLLVGVIFAIVGIPHGSLRGAQSFTAWNLFRIAPGLAWLALLLGWWAFSHPNAIPISEWYLVSILACGLPFLIVVNRRLTGTLRPDFRLAPDLLRFGIPSALASLPQTINLRFDQILIIALLPARVLGFYIVAVAWSGGVAPVLSAIGSVLFPHISAEMDTERRGYLLARALQGSTLVAIATSVPFMLLAPVGLPLVFGARFAPSIPSALLLVPAGAILAWAGVAEEGLRGLGRPTIVLTAELAAAAVTVGTLPLLLHTYGIFGAAIASFLGYLTVAIVAVTAISRSTHHSVALLVTPRWAFIKSLVARSFSLLPVLRHKGERVG